MKTHHMFPAIFMIIFGIIEATCGLEVKKFPLRMPDIHPDRDDIYICTSVRVVPDKNFYIVGFEPNATMDTVHHMLVFGCAFPGTTEELWDCGEMSTTSGENGLNRASPCEGSSPIIFAWGLNAKPLKLPDDVGFKIGKNTEIQYIVLQMHYLKKFKENKYDHSGLNLIYTEEPQNKLAGVIVLSSGGFIPPHTKTHMEIHCEMEKGKTIYPFAYRTHTHSLGRVVSGYAIHRDRNGEDHWTLLGKRDPMTPQMFYPVFSKTPIAYGDRLAARCTMDSSERNGYTKIGSTHMDEMCNFYLMYYVENDEPLEMKYCVSRGPPDYYWKNIENNLNNIPDREASTLDD